ncbi:hypothetical protein [Bdellovibrio sp. NC01]|uniref:hypothetical protein n=1 Tax=Bdellovibrio sp. NC01 TaxID=2220073 RepID=UPI0011580F0B|nr:hypothetical protein [Bdellovibrio sp. NC01]QDK37935.1 hypothetical protein DOE51_10230 [Bdellovibrio sp. NC01]
MELTEGGLLFIAVLAGLSLVVYLQIFIALPLNQILKDQTDDMSFSGPRVGAPWIAIMGFDQKINAAAEKSNIRKYVVLGRVLVVVCALLIWRATTPLSDSIVERLIIEG